MKNLSISFKNCYGIKALDYIFDFGTSKPQRKSFSIYAPNGLMKTSLTKTFERLAAGQLPEEERFNKEAEAIVLVDGVPISPESIYVLKSEINLSNESPEISNILVNPERKKRYDSLILAIDKQKKKAISSLQKLSGVTKNLVESKISTDIGGKDLLDCINILLGTTTTTEAELPYNYATIFDSKVEDLFKKPDFIANAQEFSERYQEIFTQEGTIFKKDIFNPAKADSAIKTLKSQGYFEGGHLLFLQGDEQPVGIEEVEQRINKILAKINNDEKLKTIKEEISANVQTQAIAKIFENLSMSNIEYLLEGLKPENKKEFKATIWKYYLKNNPEIDTYINLYQNAKSEIKSIEDEAAGLVPAWISAIDLFNDRFTDMPFTLEIENHVLASLGKEKAIIKYVFEDEDKNETRLERTELQTLSQGERRALYLLNFIFEVEAKSKMSTNTIFIIDDIADSFDYKNKTAIIQYLEDLEHKQNLYQIILTHNYDFFRSLACTNIVHRNKCLMANKHPDKIELKKAEGIENYFEGILKRDFDTSLFAMCATIPFTRNIIEYTKGTSHPYYLKLTSLLHKKKDTNTITHQEYVDIYNETFNLEHKGCERIISEVIFTLANDICDGKIETGLSLEDKVLMSIAIRLKAEDYMLQKIRTVLSNPEYWCEEKNQFGKLLMQYKSYFNESISTKTLRRVSTTISSNIHLNSFMYEPIIDLSLGHLKELYEEVNELPSN